MERNYGMAIWEVCPQRIGASFESCMGCSLALFASVSRDALICRGCKLQSGACACHLSIHLAQDPSTNSYVVFDDLCSNVVYWWLCTGD